MSLDPDRLAELTSEALERTAMVFADPAADEAPSGSCSFASSVSFTGPAGGRVLLIADEGFVREAAASLLGIDEDEVAPGEDGVEALRELSNIVAGSVVAELGGRDAPFTMGLPETVDAAGAGESSSASCSLETESGRLEVRWFAAA